MPESGAVSCGAGTPKGVPADGSNSRRILPIAIPLTLSPPAAFRATSAFGGIIAEQSSTKSLNKAFRDMVKTEIVPNKAGFYAVAGLCDKASNR